MQTTVQGSYVGIDWGDKEHYVYVLDAQGRRQADFVLPQSAEGLGELVRRLRPFDPIEGVAIEREQLLLVAGLLQAGLTVYPVNPKLVDTWAKCVSVDPPKDDRRAAATLAEGLRQFGDRLRPLRPEDPLTRQIQILAHHESQLIGQRTAFVNQLKDILKLYYPDFFDWFEDLTTTTACDFLIAFPTPQALRTASANHVRRQLRAHDIRLTEPRQALLAARAESAWPLDPVAAEAHSPYAVTLARQIKAINVGLADHRARIEALFPEHPDAAIFDSLPGAGPKLAPRLLAHFGTDRGRFDSARAVQALSGAVPLTKASGGKKEVVFRWACQKGFRNTVQQFAFCSLRESSWARAFYDQAKARGFSNAKALRELGAKWLKIIYRLWQTQTLYNEAIYLRSLRVHGSPLAARLGLGEQPVGGQ
jgi:transposase